MPILLCIPRDDAFVIPWCLSLVNAYGSTVTLWLVLLILWLVI